MKQTAKKKPRTFRTLIRRIPIIHKTARRESNEPIVRGKSEKQERDSTFFFGP